MKRAGADIDGLMSQLSARIAEHGYAPAAHEFDAATWAHRGKVLSQLMAAACRADLSGTDRRVLDVVALKLLGLQNSPQGRLTVANVAEYLECSKRAVDAALARLAVLEIVLLSKHRNKLGIMLHPSVFRISGGSPTCGQLPVDMCMTVHNAQNPAHSRPSPSPQTPLPYPTARLVSPPSPQRPRQSETPQPNGPPARILTVAVASGSGSPRGPGFRPATTTPATTTAQGGERLIPAPATTTDHGSASPDNPAPLASPSGWRKLGRAIATAAAALIKTISRPLDFSAGATAPEGRRCSRTS